MRGPYVRPFMPFEDARSHLRDILESIELIEQFVSGMDFEAFIAFSELL